MARYSPCHSSLRIPWAAESEAGRSGYEFADQDKSLSGRIRVSNSRSGVSPVLG